MIILNTKQFYQSSRITLEQFKKLVYINYKTIVENDPEVNLVIKNMHSDKDIDKAINSLTLDKDDNIITLNQTNSDVLLRYLEYGGESIKAPHILSKAKKSLERRSLNVQ